LREELGVTLVRSVEDGRVHAHGAGTLDELEIRFFAAAIAESDLVPLTFEKIAWALPKELGSTIFWQRIASSSRIGHRTDQTSRNPRGRRRNGASQGPSGIDSSYLKGPL